MPKPKKVCTTVRAKQEEHRLLKQRAKAANLSLNAFLIECGLSDNHRPDKVTRATRERAVFELHQCRRQLESLSTMVNQTTDESFMTVLPTYFQALNAVVGAVVMLESSYRADILDHTFTHNPQPSSEHPSLFEGAEDGDAKCNETRTSKKLEPGHAGRKSARAVSSAGSG